MWRVPMMFIAAVSLAACSWVQLTPQGEKVRVLSAEEVAKCEYRGKTTVSLLAKVAGLDRHPEQVQEELNLLARNSAVDLKGDTVAPLSPVSEGRQVFGVYRCMP